MTPRPIRRDHEVADDRAHDLQRALDVLDVSYEALAGRIRAWPDPEEAFTLATQLADAERRRADVAARLRAECAARIAEAEKMSLASLANRIGVSRARASQLLQAATRSADKEEPTDDDDR